MTTIPDTMGNIDPPWWSPPQFTTAPPQSSIIRYALASDLTQHPVQVLIHGARLPCDVEDVCVSVRIISRMNEPILGISLSTRCGERLGDGSLDGTSHERIHMWRETLTFPINIPELELDAVFEFSVWASPNSTLIGRAYCPLFQDDTARLRGGKQEIEISSLPPELPISDESRGPLANEFEEEEERRRAPTDSSLWLRKLSEARLLQLRRNRSLAVWNEPTPIHGVLAIEFNNFDGIPVLYNVTQPPASIVNFSHKLLLDESQPFPWKSFAMVFSDPRSLHASNPVEDKYSRLSRSLDRLLTVHEPPNTEERARIDRALQSSDTKPRNREEADLLWKFRNSLTHNPRALIKFLASVDWGTDFQAQQATQLMAKWSTIDVADALRLLSGQAEFAHPRVRELAVESLARSADDRLQRYLPQLVQALRYDSQTLGGGGTSANATGGGIGASMTSSAIIMAAAAGPPPLARFLISRAVRNAELATMLYWHLRVELARDNATGTTLTAGPFAKAFTGFMNELSTHHVDIKACIDAQEVFVREMMGAVKHANALKGNKEYRTRRLKEALDVLKLPLETITLPLYPKLKVAGMVSSTARIMPSTTYPAVVSLLVQGGSVAASTDEPDVAKEFVTMFKSGDDLRQDQLVIQLLELMDTIFKDVGLDLEMTRYRTLATGATEGLVEFVADALPISKVKKDHGGIPQFLAKEASKYGGLVRVLDRFVRSSAGYAVSTYVLGVGDRHLDNILVRPNGALFHVDFGFVFGRDKRGASPVRLTEEMIEAMGGRNSSGFRSFRSHACEAYKALRAQSNLLLSVVALMADAGLTDLSVNQQVEQTIEGLKTRLQLAQVSDDKAEERLLAVIDESVDALGPIVIEMFHTLAQGLG